MYVDWYRGMCTYYIGKVVSVRMYLCVLVYVRKYGGMCTFVDWYRCMCPDSNISIQNWVSLLYLFVIKLFNKLYSNIEWSYPFNLSTNLIKFFNEFTGRCLY